MNKGRQWIHKFLITFDISGITPKDIWCHEWCKEDCFFSLSFMKYPFYPVPVSIVSYFSFGNIGFLMFRKYFQCRNIWIIIRPAKIRLE
jgi:hypothetical protein